MITCLRCSEKNDEQALVCKKCGHKLQSRRVGKGEEHAGARVPEPLGRGSAHGGSPLLLQAAEVVGACVLLLATLGYGLVTGRWWPTLIAGGASLLLVVLRRS